MSRQEYRVGGLPEPFSHYTDAVRAGDLLFVSGCVALDAEGKLVGEGDPPRQAEQVIANLREQLRSVGSDLEHVLATDVPRPLNAASSVFFRQILVR